MRGGLLQSGDGREERAMRAALLLHCVSDEIHPLQEKPMRFAQLSKVLLIALAGLWAGPALAQGPADTQREVGHLLDYVARPDCQFNRNGTWYEGAAAKAHLKQKYDYLVKRNLAPTAEAFIERAATSSSTSGAAYQVRCAGTPATPSGPWLTTELRRYRSAGAKP
jgi:hypothetical protein